MSTFERPRRHALHRHDRSRPCGHAADQCVELIAVALEQYSVINGALFIFLHLHMIFERIRQTRYELTADARGEQRAVAGRQRAGELRPCATERRRHAEHRTARTQ